MVSVILAAVILILLSAVVLAAPVNKYENAQLKVVEEYNNYKTDGFNWGYVLSDGQVVRQSAYSILLEDGTKVLAIKGFYSFVAPDGVKYAVRYNTDQNGYHPTVIVPKITPVGNLPPILTPLSGFDPSSAYTPPGEDVPTSAQFPKPVDYKVLCSLCG